MEIGSESGSVKWRGAREGSLPAHSWSLQRMASTRTGHGFPPLLAGETTLRVRVYRRAIMSVRVRIGQREKKMRALHRDATAARLRARA